MTILTLFDIIWGMKNKSPFIVACSEAGKRGASRRWAGHCSVSWTSIRVSTLTKLHLQQSASQYGFTSLNEFLNCLYYWGDDIMKRRSEQLKKRNEQFNKIKNKIRSCAS